jgi:tRNA-specific 2-thiouridylase
MSSEAARTRVMVGLSGGVDSAVAALLLQQQGYQVEALFMKNWDEDDEAGYCPAAEDLKDAEQVAERLGIPLHKVSFSTEYWDRVFEYFLAEYRGGRTPNPDVMCNKEIKFKAFLDYALALGADCIATGHYARVRRHEDRWELLRGLDLNKDQSYFLYQVSQSALSRTLFPLGEYDKATVRRLAQAQGFANHAKKDSTGICFIGERKFQDFLRRYLPAQPGEIHSLDGLRLGTHQGLMFHTIGQRQGLGIGGLKEGSSEAWYVTDKDLARNRLIVAQGKDHPALFHRSLRAAQLHWVTGEPAQLPLRCTAKIRYRQQDQPCQLEADEAQHCRVRFDSAQRAVTPGQSVVFYQGEICLGGGIIESRS